MFNHGFTMQKMAIEWDMDVDRTGMEIASGYATAIEMAHLV